MDLCRFSWYCLRTFTAWICCINRVELAFIILYLCGFGGDRITADELPDLDIEISVLSPMKKTDDPLSLRLGIDGIYITNGRTSGCFLPQVATETGWNEEDFLSFCCAHKAGLAPDAWKTDPDVEVYLFTAEIFGGQWNDIQ